MSDTPDLPPERIWAIEHSNRDRSWTDNEKIGKYREDMEYIRADLHEAERARAEKAEAERDALAGKLATAESALRGIVAVPSSMADADEMERIARVTLAEITGGGNE